MLQAHVYQNQYYVKTGQVFNNATRNVYQNQYHVNKDKYSTMLHRLCEPDKTICPSGPNIRQCYRYMYTKTNTMSEPGQVFNNATGTCIPKPIPCLTGQVFNNATQTCQPDKTICPSDQKLDNATGTCLPKPILCQTGQVFNNATRICEVEQPLQRQQPCATGQVFNDATGTCDLEAKLRVIVNVINDNGGKKVANDFSYSLSGNNKPPSTVFNGVSGKGTLITLNPGIVSVVMKGPIPVIPSSSSINFPPNQSYKVAMNNCKNINLKGRYYSFQSKT